MDVITIMKTIGSIAVFMVGFNFITGSLLGRMNPWLKKLIEIQQSDGANGYIKRMIFALLSGSGTSSIVFLVSLVDSRIIQLKRTPWILLGMNLGTTITVWIIALGGYHFEVTRFALLFLAVALPFKLSSFLSDYKYGDILAGVGFVLLGINLLTTNLQYVPDIIEYLLSTISGDFIWFVTAFAFGILFSLVVRSSIGTIILAMAFGSQGWLSFDLCAAIVLGSSLGVTAIGYLAAKNLGTDASRTAFIHFLLNLGACIGGSFLFLMSWYTYFPGDIPFRLAFFHTVIHLGNLLIMLPFQSLLVDVSKNFLLEKERRQQTFSAYKLNPLPGNLPVSLDSNIILMQSGLISMADKAYEMLMIIMNASQNVEVNQDMIGKIEKIKSTLALLEYELSIMLTESIKQPCTREQAEKIRHQQRVAYELRKVGDACYKSMRMLLKSRRKGYRFHQESQNELFDFTAQVLDFLRYIADYLEDKIKNPDLDLAEKMENSIDKMRNRLKKRARKNIEKNKNTHVKGELAFIEIIGYLEHIGDSCLSISETIPQIKMIKNK